MNDLFHRRLLFNDFVSGQRERIHQNVVGNHRMLVRLGVKDVPRVRLVQGDRNGANQGRFDSLVSMSFVTDFHFEIARLFKRLFKVLLNQQLTSVSYVPYE